MSEQPSCVLDVSKLADAIEGISAWEDPELGRSFAIWVGEPAAVAIASALRAVASRFDDAERLPGGHHLVCRVILGEQGRSTVLTSLRASSEHPRRPAYV